MRPAVLALLLAIISASCSASPGGAEPDAGQPDPDSGVAFNCLEGRAIATQTAARALVDTLIASLWAIDANGANANFGGDYTGIQGINLTLDLSEDDPAEAALHIFTQLGGSPFREHELRPIELPDWGAVDSAQVLFERFNVDGILTQFHRPALTTFLIKNGDGWRLASASLRASVTLATDEDVRFLAACTPETPPADDLVRDTIFTGLSMRNCGPVGTYEYVPNAADQIAYQGPVTWDAVGEDWRIVQDATLTIAPENYWENIIEADCLCDDDAGYRLIVDLVRGEVIQYFPGIRCVVC